MHLFGKACSIRPGESRKIPLSFNPTQSQCVFTQPQGDPAQAGPDRQIHPRQKGLHRNRAELRVHSVILLQGNHQWSYHYGMVLKGGGDTRLEESGHFFVTTTREIMFGWLVSALSRQEWFCLLLWVTVSQLLLCLHQCYCTSTTCHKPNETPCYSTMILHLQNKLWPYPNVSKDFQSRILNLLLKCSKILIYYDVVA